MIITSEALKHLIMLELTVPWEERIEEANERKRAKYQELVEECIISKRRCIINLYHLWLLMLANLLSWRTKLANLALISRRCSCSEESQPLVCKMNKMTLFT